MKQFTIDATGFAQACREIARTTGIGLRPVIRAEAGSILKACAGDTKVATQQTADVRARVRLLRSLGYTQAREPGDVSINAGLRGERGRVWQRTRNGKFRLAGSVSDRGAARWENRHFSDLQWADVRDATADFGAGIGRAISGARAAIGLARQSWVQIADSLGISLESVPGGRISAAGIAKARRAMASSGRTYANGTGREQARAQAFFIEIVNRLPYGRKIQLDAILARNVNGRARFFRENLARGVFNHLSTIAKKYPGLKITGG